MYRRWGTFFLLWFIGSFFFVSVLYEKFPVHHLGFLCVSWAVVVLWITELAPLGVASLLFPVAGTLFNIVSVKEAFSPFAHPIIFLFLGSFLIAYALEKHEAGEWVARKVLNIDWLRKSPVRIVFSLGWITFFFSMWLSNTATTAVMIPIALSLSVGVPEQSRTSFRKLILLSIAYGASIGGTATPVGTPPNLIALGYFESLLKQRIHIDFLQWFLYVFPLSFILYSFALIFLYWLYGKGLHPHIKVPHIVQKPLTSGGRYALYLFFLLIFLWFTPGFLRAFAPDLPITGWLETHFPEALPAVGIGIILFLVKDGKGEPLLSRSDLMFIDWDTLLLFGGGLSFGLMAKKIHLFKTLLQAFPLANSILIIGLFITVVVFLTELFSNTATANIFIPPALVIAQTHGVSPVLFGMIIALSSSMAFMLPVATPPNAMIFGTRIITLKEMARAGFVMNLMAIGSIWVWSLFMIHVVL